MKRCSKCGEEKPLEAFEAKRAQCRPCVAVKKQRYYSANRDRFLEYQKRYQLEHSEKRKDRMLRWKFGISSEQYAAILEEQGHRCAICRADNPGGHGAWHVDHDHETNMVRGLLCVGCNVGIGNFRDDPIRLQRAIHYLLDRRRKEGVA